MIIKSSPMSLFKEKIKQFKEALDESVAEQRAKAGNDALSLGLMTGAYGAVGTFMFGSMASMLQLAYTNDGLGAAVASSVAITPMAGVVGAVIGVNMVPACIALGQVIKEKMQENKLDFSLGISEKIRDDTLASKICKILRELSSDKEKFAKFAELVDLNKDDVNKIEQLIKDGNKEVKEKNIAEGKKDYSEKYKSYDYSIA